MKDKYLESFTNDCDETWWFNYNNKNNMGMLWGNDNLIEGKIFYIFNGICPELILDTNEKDWIRNIWNKYSKYKNTYLNFPTEIKYKNNTYLTNNYCPICLKQHKEFEGHHCIPASLGGSDDYVNMLIICNSCHSLITNGCEEDRNARFLCAINHQISIYGIDFYKMNPLNNKRFKNKDIGLYKNYPYIKNILNYYDQLDDNGKIIYNNNIKTYALYYYKYYRSIINNTIYT